MENGFEAEGGARRREARSERKEGMAVDDWGTEAKGDGGSGRRDEGLVRSIKSQAARRSEEEVGELAKAAQILLYGDSRPTKRLVMGWVQQQMRFEDVAS